MLARAILLLSCLLSTTAFAQAQASDPSGKSGESGPASSASEASPDTVAQDSTLSSETTTSAGVSLSSASPDTASAQGGTAQAGTTTAEVTDTDSPEALRNAVPIDQGALVQPAPAPAPASSGDIESDPLFTPAVVLIGTGSAALLASLFTGLGAHGIYTSLEDSCPNNICSGDKEHRISSGKALAIVSTVLTGVGVAAAGVGTALLILATNREDRPPQRKYGITKLQLTGGPTPLGVGASGSF